MLNGASPTADETRAICRQRVSAPFAHYAEAMSPAIFDATPIEARNPHPPFVPLVGPDAAISRILNCPPYSRCRRCDAASISILRAAWNSSVGMRACGPCPRSARQAGMQASRHSGLSKPAQLARRLLSPGGGRSNRLRKRSCARAMISPWQTPVPSVRVLSTATSVTLARNTVNRKT